MDVSKQLKKQMIMEIIALIFLIGVLIYAVFSLRQNHENQIASYKRVVVVIDDDNFKDLRPSSDGQGLESDGVVYTVTNNRKNNISYKVIVIPSTKEDDVLKQIRISVDDVSINNLVDLDREQGGYVLIDRELASGYTKRHLIKSWYRLDTNKKTAKEKVTFEFKFVS